MRASSLCAAIAALVLFSVAPLAQPRLIQSGDVIEGRLGSGDAQLESDGTFYQVYLYSGQPNDDITITLRSSDFDAYLMGGLTEAGALAREDGNDDGGGGTDAEIVTRTGASGQYTIIVNTISKGENGTYRLSVTSQSGLGAGRFTRGQTVQGALERSDDVLDDGSYYDLHTYYGTPGERVTITMRSSDFDAYLTGGPIVNGALVRDASDDDGAGGTDARITGTVAADGTYGVWANSVRAGSTGAYTLEASSGAGPFGGDLGGGGGTDVIRAGQTVSGRLSASDATLSDESFYDLYEFSGSPYEEIEITLSSGAFDAYLAGGPTAATIGADTDDDGAGGTDSQLRVQANASGQYFIRANSLRAGMTGDYSLAIRSASGSMAGADGFPVLTLGATASGELNASDETLNDGTYYDVYTYQGRPGEEVVISMTSPDFDTFLLLNRVFGGELEKVADDDDGGEGLNSQIRVTLSQSGTYVVIANSAFAGGSGSYTLSVSRPGEASGEDAGSSLASIETGQTVNGTLDSGDTALADESYADLYVFRGTPGETVAVTLRSSDFDAYLSVASVSGDDLTIVARDDDSAGGSDAQITLSVTGTGVYAIQANSYGANETGAYSLLVERTLTPEATERTVDARYLGKWAPATYASTDSYSELRDTARRERRLERTAEGLNEAFPLPRNVSLSFEECGQPNAFYNPRAAAVSFCYELVEFLESALRSQVEADRLEEAISGAYEFIMLHEVGHALTDQLDLPITGREEDVADQFAALRLIQEGTKGARAAIDGVLALQQGNEFSSSDYADEHSLGPVRLYNVVCLVYGSDPQKYAGLVGEDGLPEERAYRCPGEYAQVEKAFSRLLGFVYSE